MWLRNFFFLKQLRERKYNSEDKNERKIINYKLYMVHEVTSQKNYKLMKKTHLLNIFIVVKQVYKLIK